jgi:tetratricopeptide (TPR) repeat protein
VVGARALLEKSIALNPNKAAAFQFLAWCTFSTGDYVGAIEPNAKALELDPFNVSVVAESGWPFGYAGLHDLARRRYERAIAMDPGFGLGHYNLGACYHFTGQLDRALQSYERAIECMGPSAWVLAFLAMVHIESGQPEKAEGILAQLHEQSRSGIAVWLSIGMVLDALGRTDEAMNALERSIADHEPFVWGLALEGWLRFPNARRTARFSSLLARLGARPHDVARQRQLLLEYESRANGPSRVAPASAIVGR